MQRQHWGGREGLSRSLSSIPGVFPAVTCGAAVTLPLLHPPDTENCVPSSILGAGYKSNISGYCCTNSFQGKIPVFGERCPALGLEGQLPSPSPALRPGALGALVVETRAASLGAAFWTPGAPWGLAAAQRELSGRDRTWLLWRGDGAGNPTPLSLVPFLVEEYCV